MAQGSGQVNLNKLLLAKILIFELVREKPGCFPCRLVWDRLIERYKQRLGQPQPLKACVEANEEE